jgi:hypothetical protein
MADFGKQRGFKSYPTQRLEFRHELGGNTVLARSIPQRITTWAVGYCYLNGVGANSKVSNDTIHDFKYR